MIKQNSDPFLAQTTAMLIVLLVIYVFGGDGSVIEPILVAMR